MVERFEFRAWLTASLCATISVSADCGDAARLLVNCGWGRRQLAPIVGIHGIAQQVLGPEMLRAA